MPRWLRYYLSSYVGFRREIWMLTLVSLVNRAGTMVIPFLSLYLTGNEGLTLQEVGWVMSAFGLGSLVGSWSGGRLSDKIGFYRTMLWSMLAPGLLFILLQYVHSFVGFCVAIFLVMSVADMFRPAMYVALRTYSREENRTRSVTLIRLAINLGYSVGPAVGGFIIARMGYGSLFWVDGITCLLAGLVIWMFIPSKDAKPEETNSASKTEAQQNHSPWRDRPYMLFLFASFLVAFAFLQLFSTVPLYYRDIHGLSEDLIGLLLASNGVLIFLTEMPIIKYTEEHKWPLMRIVLVSVALIGMSFIVLNVWASVWVLVIGMFLITLGEMLNFPIANRIAMDRASSGKVGAYMGLYTISFSIAHILGYNGGLFLIDQFGYAFTWWIMGGTCGIALLIIFFLQSKMTPEITR